MIRKNHIVFFTVPGKIKTSLILIFVAFGINVLSAQEMLGIVNSSRSGISGSMINPAVPVTSPFYIDINLFSVDVFAENNYIYMAEEEYRFKRFLMKDPQFPTHGEDDNLIVYDYYNSKDKKAYGNVRLLGPSFSVTYGKHSFGLITGARAVMSAKNIPYDIAKFGFEQLEYPPQYDINYVDNRNIYNAEMAWAEFGFNYSYVVKQQGLDYWAAGATIKLLRGYAGGYFTSENIDYVLLDRDTLIVYNINAEAGYSLPIDYETNELSNSPLFRGKGIGLDLGVIYEKKKSYARTDRVDKLCAQVYIPYKYKVGISLLDIGRIKFKENAERLVFSDASTYWPGVNSVEFNNVNDFTNIINNQFYGDSAQLVQGNEVKIALPTAISIQADYNYKGNWFVNGTLVYPLQFSKSGIIRPVLFGLTPRYETSLFEVSLPITLYDWTKPRIGLSARFMGFFVGTEKLSGFFHFTDFTGLDFYAGLKLSFNKGNCRRNTPSDNCGIEEYKKYTKSKTEKKPRNKKIPQL